jgi:hypothetical protein
MTGTAATDLAPTAVQATLNYIVRGRLRFSE